MNGCPSSLALVLVYRLVVGSAARLRCRVVRERCVQCTNVRKRLPLAQPRRRPGKWRRCSWTPRTIEAQVVYGAESPSYSRLGGIIGALRRAFEVLGSLPIPCSRRPRALAIASQSVARLETRSHEGRRRPSVARRGPAARARHHVCGPEPPFLHWWCLSCRSRRGDQGQRLLAAGPALRLRRAGAVHRRGDDEVPPRQAPRDLRRRHQRQARREGPAADRRFDEDRPRARVPTNNHTSHTPRARRPRTRATTTPAAASTTTTCSGRPWPRKAKEGRRPPR